MARSKFKFDERGLRKVANNAAAVLAAKLSTMLNGMSSEFAGRPVEEIKPVLRQRWAVAAGRPIADPKLAEYAEQISRGESFNVGVKK